MDAIRQFFMTAPVPPDTLAPSLWLIIALPLLGAFICGVFGRKLGRGNVHLVALGAVAGSFVLSVLAFWAVSHVQGGRPVSLTSSFSFNSVRYAMAHDFGTWFSAGDFRVNFGLMVDHLNAILLLVITGVGFLIHLYSTSYMEHDEGYWRYFAYLNLFVAAMLTLVLADNLVLLFVGWEGVGMCSYLLIGFWYNDAAKAWAGRKAFIANRVGDFAFLIATFLLVLTVGAFQRQADNTNFAPDNNRPERYAQGLSAKGPLTFQGLEAMANALPHEGAAKVTLHSEIVEGPLAGYTFGGVITAILLLFLLGASGKSAQLPLYVWLPDAMAGPTPVSALIHAATMVTAGVYLFCRMSFLLVLSPTAMAVILIIGTLTSLLAALIAFAQDDIKKVLAYSTVSQLGIMFMGVGAGIFWAAALHLVTHAFFKACLFLGAGSVMHGNGDETDIKKLGGLRTEMRWTWVTFMIATLAITGIVPLSGFFSKDAILHGVHHNQLGESLEWVSHLCGILGYVIAASTAFYMTRLYLLTFEGRRSSEARLAHAHESSWLMTLPLVILAVLSVVAAVYAFPLMQLPSGEHQPVFENFLNPVFASAERIAAAGRELRLEHELPHALDYFIAWLIALAGGALAAFLYMRFFPAQAGKPAPAWARAIRRAAQNKFYVDEAYEFVVIRPLKFLSMILYRVFDALLIDTVMVRGTAWVTTRVGSALRYVQTGDAQSYAAVMALALLGGVAYALIRVLS
ncbi:NADH-quinone oxidoreductase subunit L [Aggregicoccus sp. 17bor-14]|uniref:NADH-quinone oxidoreductase subunit L n=1 Tax=Myxococcaceae TaxID=31 RepID=UPI00129CD60B|nr:MULTISPECIES: NADH-quinone oxidoreductase subunit L [Myxococcaceae]MBF5045058.1 NADH-quinone oxidoreductase subunit L [Simulacricoccus sp. 17bor-14]MRI90800.1 NADH-quinone oxidoreductase subunit L [Aggregicoccus sp. 17bor-14]